MRWLTFLKIQKELHFQVFFGSKSCYRPIDRRFQSVAISLQTGP
uniref:Uncharacterized protein n=1 Tax=Ciona savignyi TaxID=51511 RepID=H2YEP5_CIOSA